MSWKTKRRTVIPGLPGGEILSRDSRIGEAGIPPEAGSFSLNPLKPDKKTTAKFAIMIFIENIFIMIIVDIQQHLQFWDGS